MPELQQLPMSLPSSPTDCGTPDSTNSNGCDTEPLNILHTHSINSIHSLLLDQAYISDNEGISSTSSNKPIRQGHGNGQANETMSITDLLGLNSPRGTLLGNSFNNSTESYFSNSPRNYHQDNKQTNRDEFNYGFATNNPIKSYNRNNEQYAACTPPSQSSFINSRIGRNSTASFNDANSTAGSNIDSNLFLSNTSSRSNSPADSDTSLLSNLDNINELMSSLGLNINNQIPASALNTAALNAALNSNNPLTAAATANFLNGVTELERTNLQNLQAIHALKYLQQQPPVVLGSLLQYSPVCSRNNQWTGTAASILSNLTQQSTENSQNIALDRAARFHRNSASLYDATCTWSGVLPQRTQKPTGYSSKVFLGGVPWDISEQLLMQTFKQFGSIKVEWPGKEKQACQPKGYVYIIFESEKQVRSLLQSCTHDYVNGGSWFFKISSKRMKSKEAQVIPWIINDSNHVKSTSHKLDPSKTVFVGALHGMLTAEGLAKIMNDLFEGVIYAGIDTDKYKYPIGSGRVTFNNNRSYMKAVTAAFIEIKTTKFTKKVQVDPYLEDSLCSFCAVQQGPYFCRELLCFRYFCRPCWQLQHTQDAFRTHKPLMRNSKTATIVGLNVEHSQHPHHNHPHQQQSHQVQQSHWVSSPQQLHNHNQNNN